MSTSGHLMDQDFFDELAKFSCQPDCNPTPTHCLDAWSNLDVGVTASEAGRAVTPESTHGQMVGALIIASIILFLAALILLVWLVLKRYSQYELKAGFRMARFDAGPWLIINSIGVSCTAGAKALLKPGRNQIGIGAWPHRKKQLVEHLIRQMCSERSPW